MHLSLAPLLPFAVAFMIGIFARGIGIGAAWLLVPVAGSVALWRFGWQGAAVSMSGVVLGWVAAEVRRPAECPQELFGRQVEWSGVVGDVVRSESTQVLAVWVDSCGGHPVQPFGLKLVVAGSEPRVSETWRLSARAAMRPPVFSPVLPDEVDFDASLRRSGVSARAVIHPESLICQSPEPGILNEIRRLRPALSEYILGSDLSPESAAFVNAVLTGDRSALTPEMTDLFAATGLSHLLALSGLHVGIVCGLAALLLWPLSAVGLGRLRVCLVVAVGWGFAVVTGLGPSVVRAALMATALAGSMLLERRPTPYNSLALAVLVILVFSPSALFSLGFQLSFLAVLSILVFASAINPVPRRFGVLHVLAGYPAVTLAAVAGTLLVTVGQFGVFPMYFLPANLLASLLAAPAVAISAVWLLLASLGVDAHWIVGLVDFLVRAMLEGARVVASFPGALAEGLVFTPFVGMMWMLMLVSFGLALHMRRVAFGVAGMMFTCVALAGIVLADPVDASAEGPYVVSDSRHTSLLIPDGDTLRVVSSAHTHRVPELVDEFSVAYSRYMTKRGISAVASVPQTFDSDAISRAGHLVGTRGRVYALFSRRYFDFGTPFEEQRAFFESIKGSRRVDFALVCGDFSGSVLAMVAGVGPDSVLLGADLHPRRRKAYADSLASRGVPFREVR